MKKILLGLTQQDYKLDKDILQNIDFIEIKKIDNEHLLEVDKYNKSLSLHLQRFFDENPQPSRENYLEV